MNLRTSLDPTDVETTGKNLVDYLFTFDVETTVKCVHCETTSSHTGQQNYMHCDLNDACADIASIIDSWMNPVERVEWDGCKDPNCISQHPKREATIIRTLISSPRLLFIHIKR